VYLFTYIHCLLIGWDKNSQETFGADYAIRTSYCVINYVNYVIFSYHAILSLFHYSEFLKKETSFGL